MTIVELMHDLADYLRVVLKDYDAKNNKKQLRPFEIYAGYPPQRDTNKDTPPFVYCIVSEFEQGTATVEIGISMEDSDKDSSGMELYNVLEHIRQALLIRRTIAKKHVLMHGTLKGAIAEEQRWPQWQAVITAKYSIGEPEEEVYYY